MSARTTECFTKHEKTEATWTCKELGTIIGPRTDKNRQMTSMSETRIKLSCNEIIKGLRTTFDK